MRAFGYCRVNTLHQVTHGVGLDAQRVELARFCAVRGWTLEPGDILTDSGKCGTKMTSGPGMYEALERACAAKGVMVVYSLSRLARYVVEARRVANRLALAGANLAGVAEGFDTTTEGGRLFFELVAGLARFERELANGVTAGADAYLSAHDRRLDKAPYGRRLAIGRHSAEVHPAAGRVIDALRELIEIEGASHREEVRETVAAAWPRGNVGGWAEPPFKGIKLRRGFRAGVGREIAS